MKQYILTSFVSENSGGNKAAVVFDDLGLSESKMKAIAFANNLSETAFIDINNIEDNKVQIRYFTPKEEVDVCGHAALAAFYILKQKRLLAGSLFFHITKAGKLEVRVDQDITFIEMAEPNLVCEISIEDILNVTDLKEREIIPNKNLKISIVSTGLKDIILEVKDLDILKTMNIKKEEMIDFCIKNELIGMHVVSRETIEKDSDFACRNFAPAVGIDEESATGTSNASLIYYMTEEYELDRKIFKIEQGYFMGAPSIIYVKEIGEKKAKIFVGGNVRFIEEQELFVEYD